MNRQRHLNRQSRRPPPNSTASPSPSSSSPSTCGNPRGGAHRGRGQDRNNGTPRPRDRYSLPPVPSISQVVPGAFVSIVLKVDQPTGRQVQGVVDQVLTRGDHPRGIKVMLVDGRVGRVQRMAAEGEVANASKERVFGRNGDEEVRGEGRSSVRVVAASDWQQRGRRVGGADLDRSNESEGADLNEERQHQRSLAAYFPVEELDVGQPAGQLQIHESEEAPDDADLSVCPICFNFKGDERAVTHHVNTHFAE